MGFDRPARQGQAGERAEVPGLGRLWRSSTAQLWGGATVYPAPPLLGCGPGGGGSKREGGTSDGGDGRGCGIISISVDTEKGTVTIIGDVDAAAVVKELRKAGKTVEIDTVGPHKKEEEKKKDEKKDDDKKKDEKKDDDKKKDDKKKCCRKECCEKKCCEKSCKKEA